MSDDSLPDDLLRFGWEEWVALPDLGLPALRAKVDTGARTSALHAFDIETFGPASAPRVRFTVNPVPGRDDLMIPCSARIVDRRSVTSSNGESESRYVIASTLRVADESWRIELVTARASSGFELSWLFVGGKASKA